MAKVEIIKANKELSNRNKKGPIEILRVGAYCRVSTDTENQISSYKSQVAYYDDLIDNNPKFELVPFFCTYVSLSNIISYCLILQSKLYRRISSQCEFDSVMIIPVNILVNSSYQI